MCKLRVSKVASSSTPLASTIHNFDCLHIAMRYWAKCQCPKSLAVTPDDAPRKLLSAMTRSWESAEKKAENLRNSEDQKLTRLKYNVAGKTIESGGHRRQASVCRSD
jgi:hypothetical protein